MDADDTRMLRRVADYQFGAGAGRALFPAAGDLEVYRTSSGRPQQVVADAGRLVTYGTDGRFTLGPVGGERLRHALDPPAYRVVVGDESEPFVRDGRNTFAKFVGEADAAIRPGDEVLVVYGESDGEGDEPSEAPSATDEDALLAVGRAELAGPDMLDFDTGMAVFVRHGVADPGALDA